MEVFWFIPTHGDGRYLGTNVGARTAGLPYYTQIARAVDHLGFHGVLLPTGKSCEDAWVVASSLVSVTQQLRFLVAIRPGLMSPGLAARMAVTFDRMSGGRLLINVVTGGDPVELAGDGVHLGHDERYALTDEFLSVWSKLLTDEEVDFHGQHFHIDGGKLLFPSTRAGGPELYFGGSSDPAIAVAGKHIDVYLTWGEPPEQVAEKIHQVREAAAAQGRTIRFGIRLHVIVRESEREAWEEADRLISKLSDETIAKAQKSLARHDSVGQRRMLELHQGDRSSLVLSPNLWAGVGLVRGGAGTALVGSPENVAARMREYADLGIDTFIFSGYPHLEESYRVAELLFPHLPLSKPGAKSHSSTVAPMVRGEIIGNAALPTAAAAAR